MPTLWELGLGNLANREGVSPEDSPRVPHGLMVELSAAKVTFAGHWEMMVLLGDPLPTYPYGSPENIIRRFGKGTGRRVIANKPTSGTTIIEGLGPGQEETGSL